MWKTQEDRAEGMNEGCQCVPLKEFTYISDLGVAAFA